MRRTLSVLVLFLRTARARFRRAPPASEHHYLYVAEPGIRNYVEYGGVGVLVYDIDAGYKFVRAFASQDVPPAPSPRT
jgi:hypothetical protein